MKRIKVAATGDSVITTHLPDYPDPGFQALGTLLRSCDFAFTNLENGLSDYRGTPIVETAGSTFGGAALSAPPEVARDLRGLGFNLTAFANNHAFDYGEQGFLETLEALAEIGFTCAGAGRHLTEARSPVFLDTAAGRVGLVACTSTFAPGHRAGLRHGVSPGRPGVNPQRFEVLYVVDRTHLEILKHVARQLGVETQRIEAAKRGFGGRALREGEFRFVGAPRLPPPVLTFIEGDDFQIRTALHQEDLEGNIAALRDARARSDLVLASVHAHEQGRTQVSPPDFLVDLAHAAIDAGADMVIGHGPHVLRGIELYKRKPIFYSLGMFIYQGELIRYFPPDDLEKNGLAHDASAEELLSHRRKRGLADQTELWESILPVCTFEGARLTEIRLHPITLGRGTDSPARGTPRIADREVARKILRRLAELSESWGTRIDDRDGIGHVEIQD